MYDILLRMRPGIKADFGDMLCMLQSVNCVCYNADSSVLLSGSYDKTIRAWDIRLRNPNTGRLSFVVFTEVSCCLLQSSECVLADSSSRGLSRQRHFDGSYRPRDHRGVSKFSLLFKAIDDLCSVG